MLISGIQKFTLLDFPHRTACIVFTPGCNFRCGYCHNPEFVLPERIKELRDSFIPEQAIFLFLEERRGLLDGVVITGGEPTLMPDLLSFIRKVKSLGFLVKLDTNGNRPHILKEALEKKLVDYVAMDVKTSLDDYQNLTGKLVSPARIAESIEILKQSNIEYEFRSTLIKEVHSSEILKAMSELLQGAERLYLQSFRPTNTLNPTFQKFHPFDGDELTAIAELFKNNVRMVYIR